MTAQQRPAGNRSRRHYISMNSCSDDPLTLSRCLKLINQRLLRFRRLRSVALKTAHSLLVTGME